MVRTGVKFGSHNGYKKCSVTHSCLRNPISSLWLATVTKHLLDTVLIRQTLFQHGVYMVPRAYPLYDVFSTCAPGQTSSTHNSKPQG